MPTHPAPHHVLLPVLLTAALVILTGCGLKVWPEPRAEEDRFSWKEITFSSHDTCLDIRAVLDGAWGNLARLDLELTPGDEDCPSCPFQASQTISFVMDASEVKREGAVLILHCCQLPASTGFRCRLVGHNVYPSLQPIPSNVMFVGEKPPSHKE